jgi:two-component system, NarL family, sensor histidine kinase UhpB
MIKAAQPRFSSHDSQFFKSVHRFQFLSIATKEGIWEYDFIHRNAFYNEGMIDLFGYSLEEMADNDSWWRNNLHPQDKARVISEVDEIMASTNSVWWGKYQFRCKDGSYKLILDRLFVVRDKKGKTLRLIGTMQDFTEIDELQQELDMIRRQQHIQMMKAIFQAEENERKNISEELNENINQVLAAINMHLSQAKMHINIKGLTWLQEAQHLLLDSISGIRNISKRLSPIVLKELGLKVALTELVGELQKITPVNFDVLLNDELEKKINVDIQTVLYRIAQYQVANIAKHSDARNAYIKIEPAANKVKLVVYDDGTGVNQKALQYGKGFANIQEKTDAFDGSFSVESAEGKRGFKIEVII